MMPPKSLINLAPPISTERKKVATKHAIAPWFGEGMRGGSLGLWWSLNGKLVALLSLEHLSCILREEIPVVGLFPAKSDVTSSVASHLTHAKPLFSSLSSFISRQAAQEFGSRRVQGAMEAKR